MICTGEEGLRKELREFDYSLIPEDRRPENGKHWICCACGKRAADRYGMIGPRSAWWDESCMLNSAPIGHNELLRA